MRVVCSCNQGFDYPTWPPDPPVGTGENPVGFCPRGGAGAGTSYELQLGATSYLVFLFVTHYGAVYDLHQKPQAAGDVEWVLKVLNGCNKSDCYTISLSKCLHIRYLRSVYAP